MILAKSVIKDKFWILEENAKRVGMMNFKDNNYSINLKRKDFIVQDEHELKDMGIEFVVRDLTHGDILRFSATPLTKKKYLMLKRLMDFRHLLKNPQVKAHTLLVGMV